MKKKGRIGILTGGGDAPGLGRDQLGAVGVVDHTRRQIEDQIDQPLARNLRDQLFQPGADARQGARLGEKRE